jgi:transglutaminase-like putative cysteine protease
MGPRDGAAEMVCAWAVRVRRGRRLALLTRPRRGGQHAASDKSGSRKSGSRSFAETARNQRNIERHRESVELQSGRAILNVRHLTTYRYKRPVEFGEHRMMMRPRDGHDQRLLSSELNIEPEPRRLRWLYDTFDNCVAVASFSGEWMSLRVENRFTVERIVDEQPGGEIDPRAQFFPFSYTPEELPDIARAIERLYADPAGDLDRWVRQFVTPGATTLTSHMLMTMTYAIKEGFSYERREAAGVQSPRHTLDRRRGSCRDFAVLMMEAARALGIAARFVSGYVYVPRGDDEPVRLGGGATHAWCQVYLPGAGWIEFDPTNGLVGGKDLIRVAVARDPGQAAPLTGAYFGDPRDELGMEVSVEVTQPKQAERVTLAGA